MMKTCKRTIDGTGTATALVRVGYLHTLLRRGDLQEFDELSSQVVGTTNPHLNFIKAGLLPFFYQLLYKAEVHDAMRHA